MARKLGAAILAALGALPGYRCRPRRLREDQRRHLDPVAVELLTRLGVISAGSLTDS